MADDERIEVSFGAKIRDLLTGLKDAAAATKDGVDQMKGHLERFNAGVEAVKTAFIGITALLAGGAMFKETIEQVANLGERLNILRQQTGMTAEQLTRLRYAAELSDVGVESLDGGMKKLARSMQDAASGGTTPAAQAFAAMGIAVADSEGRLRPMQQVLLDVAEKFSHYEDGAAKSALAMNLFGKSGADLVPLLNQGRTGIADLGAEADRLGATMSGDGVEVALQYDDAMKRVHASTSGLGRQIALAVMPALTSLADAFTKGATDGGAFNAVSEVLAGTMRFLATVVLALKEIFSQAWEMGRIMFEGLATLIAGVGMAFVAMQKGQWSGSVAIMKDTFHDMADNVTASSKRMKDSALATAQTLKELYGFAEPTSAGPAEKKRSAAAPALKGGATDAMAAAKEEWAERAAAATEGKDDLLTIEIAFWRQKMGTVTGNSKQEVALRRQYHTALLAAQKQYNADAKASGRADLEISREGALQLLDVEKQTIQERRALRQIDVKEAAEQLRANAAEAYDIKVAWLRDEMILAEGDLVKQAEVRKKAAALERAHGLELTQIGKQTTLEIAKDWEGAFSTLTNGIRTAFDGWLKGTQTFREGMRNLWRNMAFDMIASKASEVKAWAASELAKRGITTSSALHSVMMTSWSVLKNIASYAAQAAAAAWAAISAIPLVGPFLAPAVAAGAIVGVLALGSRVASAAGGYDVPAGVNPMTQLHAQEMVLPASLANAVRAMAAGGDGGGGGTQVHIHAMDAQSFRDFAKRNPEAFGDGVAAAIGSNHGGLNRALRNRG